MAPLLEETIFRLFLRYHLVNVLLSASLGAVFLLLALPATWLWFSLGGIALCLLWLLINLYKHSLPELYFQDWWHRRLPWLYFGSSLVFALVHLNNYDLPLGKSLFYAPVLVLPQFFIGLVLGYVRIRFSFGMAVLVHALHNGSLVLPILLFKGLA
ncbi:MAG: CPBP family intramembrane metalloprotease [Microscillaceae bacterium]|nr:CPBP family intramembrane metalloprotease [Microscillaceae bacterium]